MIGFEVTASTELAETKTGSTGALVGKAFDIDRRAEIPANRAGCKEENFDIDKRVVFPEKGKDNPLRCGLTEGQRREIGEKTGWSDEIIDCIRSIDEAKIYQNAGLREADVGGKKCLIRQDIDFNQKDQFGRTNSERMEQGLAPLDKNGHPLELHHIGQHADSPLAELTIEEHRGKGNDTVLHDKTKASEIDREKFALERSYHWEKLGVGKVNFK